MVCMNNIQKPKGSLVLININSYMISDVLERDLAMAIQHLKKIFCQCKTLNCVKQSALHAGHWQFVPVFCICYTIEIWKPARHCDRRVLSVHFSLNRPFSMIGGYFMHCNSTVLTARLINFHDALILTTLPVVLSHFIVFNKIWLLLDI